MIFGMITKFVGVCLLASLLAWPHTSEAGECKEFIELLSAEELAREYGKSVGWILNNVKINLWEKSTPQGKGTSTGKLLPGSRAVILGTDREDFKVKSPLDGSTGWINKMQVKRTLFQDTKTFKPCNPKKPNG